MSEILTEKTCPLGHTCKKINGDKVEVCAWLITLKGQHPATGEPVDREECAIVALPLMQADNTKATWGTTKALSSLTNLIGKADAKYLPTNN